MWPGRWWSWSEAELLSCLSRLQTLDVGLGFLLDAPSRKQTSLQSLRVSADKNPSEGNHKRSFSISKTLIVDGCVVYRLQMMSELWGDQWWGFWSDRGNAHQSWIFSVPPKVYLVSQSLENCFPERNYHILPFQLNSIKSNIISTFDIKLQFY